MRLILALIQLTQHIDYNFVVSLQRSYPERVVAGTFRGQGAVKFFIKGEDVVVTTPTEDCVTILKGGVHNPAVQRALQL